MTSKKKPTSDPETTPDKPTLEAIAGKLTKKSKKKNVLGQLKDYAVLKTCPEIVKQLLLMHDRDVNKAGKAIGVNPQSLRNVANGQTKGISTYLKNRIEAGLRGETPSPSNMHGTKKVGPTVVGVVIARVDVFERLYAIWQTMGHQWAYQRKAGSHWIGVAKANQRDIDAFAAFAKAYNAEVIMP